MRIDSCGECNNEGFTPSVCANLSLKFCFPHSPVEAFSSDTAAFSIKTALVYVVFVNIKIHGLCKKSWLESIMAKEIALRNNHDPAVFSMARYNLCNPFWKGVMCSWWQLLFIISSAEFLLFPLTHTDTAEGHQEVLFVNRSLVQVWIIWLIFVQTQLATFC